MILKASVFFAWKQQIIKKIKAQNEVISKKKLISYILN